MNPLPLGAAFLAALHVAGAQAQHSHHAQPAEPPKAAAKPAEAPKPPGSAQVGVDGRFYRSPFADYRPFTAEEPLTDWKKANDDVREAGGHVGLLKGEAGALEGHGAHGVKQAAPPAPEKK
jgi:hypothetical protein